MTDAMTGRKLAFSDETVDGWPNWQTHRANLYTCNTKLLDSERKALAPYTAEKIKKWFVERFPNGIHELSTHEYHKVDWEVLAKDWSHN